MGQAGRQAIIPSETHYNPPMTIQLNGKPHALSGPCTLAALLAALGYSDKRIAVEHNGEIVPRSRHSTVHLSAGDCIEIVVAVGGG